MKEEKTTRLTLQIGDTVATVEKAGIDPGAEDIMNMLYGCMVGHTFLPCTVIDAMQKFAEENTDYTDPDKFSTERPLQ